MVQRTVNLLARGCSNGEVLRMLDFAIVLEQLKMNATNAFSDFIDVESMLHPALMSLCLSV
jgi:hypothetical protein